MRHLYPCVATLHVASRHDGRAVVARCPSASATSFPRHLVHRRRACTSQAAARSAQEARRTRPGCFSLLPFSSPSCSTLSIFPSHLAPVLTSTVLKRSQHRSLKSKSETASILSYLGCALGGRAFLWVSARKSPSVQSARRRLRHQGAQLTEAAGRCHARNSKCFWHLSQCARRQVARCGARRAFSSIACWHRRLAKAGAFDCNRCVTCEAPFALC